MDNDKTIEVLTALANGIDPVTGEVFPPDSPYQQPTVIRALFHALMVVELQDKVKKTESPRYKSGQPWTEEEEERLRDAFLNNVSIEKLSVEHQRTEGAIRARLMKMHLCDSFGKRIAFYPKREE